MPKCAPDPLAPSSADIQKKFLNHCGDYVGSASSFHNPGAAAFMERFNVRLEQHGESWDNLLKICHLVKMHPDLRLFVQTNPVFCCPSLVTEAMARRIEEITGIPVVTVTYDGTGTFRNDKIVPYLAEARRVETGALILCGGTDYFDPSEGKNPFAYRQNPHVLTSLEFERVLSGTGPSGGRLVRPADGKPIAKIAWIQCVGSRDLQNDADFCSNACCMIAIKEALLAREKAATAPDTAI